jgi:deazaflavin-dependent oxidoreductase (nitroreductase family)
MTTTTTGTALRQPSRRAWVRACSVAEAVGMTAAASAALVATRLTDGGHAAWLALAVVVAGGLVEGTALGVLQAHALRPWLDARRRRRWAAATVLVAGVGWAAASAPASLADPGGAASAQQPGWVPVLLGAAGLGVLMGAVLGAAQAWALRGAVSHPWRWVTGSAAGWAPAMAVVFVGATAPSHTLSLGASALLGAATGVLAGLVLGLVTGWFLPSLTGTPASGRAVLAVLGSPAHRALSGALLGLRVTGARTGRRLELPVQYAAGPRGLVVVPGRPERKRWWRNLHAHPEVDVLAEGAWRPADAFVLRPDDRGYVPARMTYLSRFPNAQLSPGQPVVLVAVRGTDPTPSAASR